MNFIKKQKIKLNTMVYIKYLRNKHFVHFDDLFGYTITCILKVGNTYLKIPLEMCDLFMIYEYALCMYILYDIYK